jgi:hypothetical protein
MLALIARVHDTHANLWSSAADTNGLIIDIRNYPSEFVVFALGSLLVDRATEFARFTSGDLANPVRSVGEKRSRYSRPPLDTPGRY